MIEPAHVIALQPRELLMQARPGQVAQITQIAAVALLVLGCLLVLRPFVTALLGAAIMCYSTWPVYLWFERELRGRRTLAALVMSFLVLVVIIAPLALTAATLSDNVAPTVEWARSAIAQGPPGPPEWVRKIPLVGENVDIAWRDIASSQTKFLDALKRYAQPAQQGLFRFVIVLGEGVLQLSLAAFIGFFFYRDGAQMVAATRAAADRIAGDVGTGLLGTIGATIRSVLYGLIGTAFAQGLLALIGFLIAGIPGALLLACLTFILSLIPIGPPLVWGGATAWLVYQGEIGWAVFMGVWGVLLISGIDNVIRPIIISRGSSLPFLPVFLGVLGGVVAFGFVGIFIGPTLLAVGYTLAQRWTRPTVSALTAPR
jgi:predicted PurR-regulated permease PerM